MAPIVAQAGHKVEVVVPSTRFDKPITEAEHQNFVEQVATKLSQMFGGATAVQAFGSWYSEQAQKLIQEPITVVSSYSQVLEPDNKAAVIALAEWLARELSQEAVFITIDGVALFITG